MLQRQACPGHDIFPDLIHPTSHQPSRRIVPHKMLCPLFASTNAFSASCKHAKITALLKAQRRHQRRHRIRPEHNDRDDGDVPAERHPEIRQRTESKKRSRAWTLRQAGTEEGRYAGRNSSTHIMTVPPTRRAGDSQVGEGAARELVVVEACLNCWIDARWTLVRARADRMGDRARGDIVAGELGSCGGVLCSRTGGRSGRGESGVSQPRVSLLETD